MAEDSCVTVALRNEDVVEEIATGRRGQVQSVGSTALMKNVAYTATISKTGNFPADGIQVSVRFDGCIVLTNGQPPGDGDYFMMMLAGERAKIRISSGRWQETAQ